ncbi:uncharacterized protein LOC121411519 [Lytechinus variegatus]|uniref:uncharacterized protein LOC121411519 n=1 Tax=Lytechinus variegatus TaxID=7654 RepID=UPI001BB1A0DB|nr:uncharacterized protein LOC121411519 [Lytechinus variegatus]
MPLETYSAINAKLFVKRTYTNILLEFYCSTLPLLKKYVLVFQKKETQIHKLHDEVVDLTKSFLACYLKPEALMSDSQLKKVDVASEANFLNLQDMFIGTKAETILSKHVKKEDRKDFLTQAQKAYIAMAKCLQQKLPLTNKVLMRVSAGPPCQRSYPSTIHESTAKALAHSLGRG